MYSDVRSIKITKLQHTVILSEIEAILYISYSAKIRRTITQTRDCMFVAVRSVPRGRVSVLVPRVSVLVPRVSVLVPTRPGTQGCETQPVRTHVLTD